MLPVPIETLRVRVGLESTDASRDDDITAASDLALSLMANYCDRYFDQVLGDQEGFTHLHGFSAPLKRYPIVQVTGIVDQDAKAVSIGYHINKVNGVIQFDGHVAFHEMVVTFDGGYAEGEFPDDLLYAYYQVFDQHWAVIENGTSPGAANISSVSVVDVGTVRYSQDSITTPEMGGGFLPPIALSILNYYKRYQC